MIIKKATLKDKENLVKTVEELIEEDKNLDHFSPHYKDPKYYEEQYIKNEKYDVITLEEKQTITGYIIGKKKTNNIYTIEMHYVIPRKRGQGIAKKLKKALEEHARNQGFKLITSYASIDNHASIKLNEHTNYKQETIGNYVYFKKEL